MQLNEYPQAIADLQKELLDLEQKLIQRKEQLAFCVSVIDRTIAFDSDLKNDSQRKAKRNELMETDSDYIKASLTVKHSEALQAELDIDLKLLLNSFSILKLERREAIARMELNSSLAA